MGTDVTIPLSGPAQLQERVPAPAADAPLLALTACDWREFDDHMNIAAWDALAQCCAEPNPFYESWNLLPALAEFDPDGHVQIWALKCDGQLVGIVPMIRQKRYYGYPLPHWRNWAHANCFFGAPLVARGFEEQFWQLVLQRADNQAGAALFLHLTHMSATGPMHVALKSALQRSKRRRPAATVLCEERATLASRASPEAYYEESLTSKKRKELRRQQRRLEEEGQLAVERCEGTDGLTQWIDDFLALEQRGWKGTNCSALASDPRTARMFTSTLEGAAERGRLQRLTLNLDGKPIAMLVNFLTPPGAYSYKTTFDEDYARFSPGVLLQRENLQLLNRDDIEWADSCAAQDHPMIDHYWTERRAIACHSIGIGGVLRRSLFSTLARRETGKPVEGIL